MNKFVLIWNCGCAFSEKLMEGLKGNNKMCPNCGLPFSSKDIISLNLEFEE